MRFRTKPCEIEAQLFDGSNESAAAILYWIGQSEAAAAAAETGSRLAYVNGMGTLFIRTLESGDGYHIASPGDMIVKGLKGEFYPVKPDIFALKYEQVSASDAVRSTPPLDLEMRSLVAARLYSKFILPGKAFEEAAREAVDAADVLMEVLAGRAAPVTKP